MAGHRVLAESLGCYRIGDPEGEWPIFSGEGASLHPGRWNDRGQAAVYASLCYSTGLLEMLARSSVMPPGQHYIEIGLPAGTSYEELNEARLPGWADSSQSQARAFGARWYRERRSAILIVPSVVARVDRNVVINSEHPDFRRIRAGREIPVWWDERLFTGG